MFRGCPVLFGVSGVWRSLPLFESDQVWKSGAGLRPSASPSPSSSPSLLHRIIPTRINTAEWIVNLRVDCRQLSLTPTRRGDTFTVRGGPERIVGEKNIISCRVQQLYKLLIMTFLSPGELSDRLLWRKQAQELRQKWVQDFIEAPTKGLSQIIHQSADYSHY